MGIIVLHETLNAAKDGLLRVAKFIGDYALKTKGEDVVTFVMVMKRVSDPMEEVKSVL